MKKDYTNRFDYEQQILNTWGITDDIKEFAEMLKKGDLTPEALQGCAELYEHRFNELWQYFEGIFTVAPSAAVNPWGPDEASLDDAWNNSEEGLDYPRI